MKKLACLVALFVLVVAPALMAQQDDGPRQPRARPDFNGVVKSFNAERSELVITAGRQGEVTITLTRETRIMVGREAGTTAALTEGARVNGTFTTGPDGEKTTTAEIIRVRAAAGGDDQPRQPRPRPRPRDDDEDGD